MHLTIPITCKKNQSDKFSGIGENWIQKHKKENTYKGGTSFDHFKN